jgi:hypothetical protein
VIGVLISLISLISRIRVNVIAAVMICSSRRLVLLGDSVHLLLSDRALSIVCCSPVVKTIGRV